MEEGDVIRVTRGTAPGEERLDLKVVAEDGDEIYFKLRAQTQLQKLMQAFCTRQGIPMANARFTFDGKLLGKTDTPAALDMEDGDVIDVQIVT